MSEVLVIFHSRTGNTETMARAVAAAIESQEIQVTCKKVEETRLEEMLTADGIIIGSPTYYGQMAAEIKKFLDDSISLHGKLEGKAGGAFATSGSMGQETTVLGILEALLIHGMVIQGDYRGHHYGVTSIGKPGEVELQRCRRFGERFAGLVKKLAQ
jgi:NAD(P)H dehydrogenase (quinone)